MIDLSELDVILKKVNARKDNKPEANSEYESETKNKSNIIDLSEHISSAAESAAKESFAKDVRHFNEHTQKEYANNNSNNSNNIDDRNQVNQLNEFNQGNKNEQSSRNPSNNSQSDSIHKIDMESVRNAIKKAIESSSELQQKMQESMHANQAEANVNADAINDGIHVLDDNIISDTESSEFSNENQQTNANNEQISEERAEVIEDFCTIDGTTAKTKEIHGFFSQKAEELSSRSESQHINSHQRPIASTQSNDSDIKADIKAEPESSFEASSVENKDENISTIETTIDAAFEEEREAKAQHKSNKAEVVDGEYEILIDKSHNLNQQEIENAILGEDESSDDNSEVRLNVKSYPLDTNAAQKSHAITESKMSVNHSISGECVKIERGESENTLFNQTIIAPESVVNEAKKTLMNDVSAALDSFMLKFEIKEDVQKFGRLKLKPTPQQIHAAASESTKSDIKVIASEQNASIKSDVSESQLKTASEEPKANVLQTTAQGEDFNHNTNASNADNVRNSGNVCNSSDEYKTETENETNNAQSVESSSAPEIAIPQPQRMFVPDDAIEYGNQDLHMSEPAYEATQYSHENNNANGYNNVDYSYQQSYDVVEKTNSDSEESSSATFSMPTFSVPSQYMSKPKSEQTNEDEQSQQMNGKFLQECFHCDDKNFAVCCISMHALREFCMSSGFFNDASLSVENVQSFLVAHVSQKCKRFSVDVDGGIQYAIVMKKEEKIKLGNHQVQMKEIHTCPECQSIVSQQLGISNFSFDQILTKRIKF